MVLDLATIGIAMDTSGLEKGSAALKSAEQAANRTADSADRLGARTSSLGQKALTASDDFSRMNSELGKINSTFGRLSSLILGIVSVSTIVATVREMTTLNLALERTSNTLRFASGSSEVYATNNEFLRTTVRALGLDLQSAGQQFASLSAAARGTTLEGEGARSIFDAVTKASTVMGLTADQTAGSLLAIQQMISKGTVSAEELRGQLGERLPGAFQVAARAMGVTTAELGKMLEQGALTTDVFLPRFAAQMRLEMAGSVAEAAGSVQSNLNRVKTDWAQLVQVVTNSNFTNESLKGIDQFLSVLTGTLQKSKDDFKGWGDSIADTLAFVGDAARSSLGVIKTIATAYGGAVDLASLYVKKQSDIDIAGFYADRDDRVKVIEANYKAATEAIRNGVNDQAQALITGSSKLRDALAQQRAAQAADGPTQRRNDERRADAQRAADIELLSTKAVLGAGKSKEKAAGAYDNLNNAIERTLDLANEELLYGQKLVGSDKLRIQTLDKLQEAYADGKIEMSQWSALYDKTILAAEKMAQIETQHAEIKRNQASYQEQLDFQDQLNQAYVQESQSRERARKAVGDYAKGIDEQNELIELESRLMGVSAQAREVALAQYKVERELKKQIEAIDSSSGLDEVQRQELRVKARLASAREVVGAEARIQQEASAKSAKDTLDSWTKTTESINQSLTDSLMRGFEGGKSFAENFRDTLVNMFKTLVLRPTVSAILNPVSQGLGGLLGGGGGPSDLLGGVGSVLGSGSSIGSTIANVLPGSISSALGLTSSTLAAGNTALVGGGSSAALAANTAALAGNASALGGVGSALAAIPGWGWAALGAITLLSMGGGKFKSSWSTGNTQISSNAAGEALAQFSNQDGRPMTAESDKAAGGLRDTYLQTAKALGIGTRATEFSYAGNSGAEGESPNFALSGGVFGLGGYTQGETKITDEAIKLAASKAIFATLQNSDLPKYLMGIFDGLDAGSMSQAQLDGVLASAQAYKGLSDIIKVLPAGFENLKDAAYPALKQLVEISGGFDKLQASLSTYYDKFYTETEKAKSATSSVAEAFAKMGIQMPVLDSAARQVFRTLVESQDLTTASGQNAYASLISVSGAFDQLVTSADSVRSGIQAMVGGVSKSVGDSVFAMQYGQEDNDGKYRMLDVRASKTNDELLASKDIVEIVRLANQEIALLNQAFDLLGEDQKRNTSVEFENKLNAIDEYVTSKGVDAISSAQAQNTETANIIAAAVKTAVAEAMASSSAAIDAAASKIQAAANVPAVANISVSVTKAPGVEVSVSNDNRY